MLVKLVVVEVTGGDVMVVLTLVVVDVKLVVVEVTDVVVEV